MKKTHFLRIFILFTTLSLFFAACSNNESKKSTEAQRSHETNVSDKDTDNSAIEPEDEIKAEDKNESEDKNDQDASDEEKPQEENDQENSADQAADEFIEVNDIHGSVKVPFKPHKVVALDNRTFETLADWGIELLAVPKDVMPADSPYCQNSDIENIGNHREPKLEIIAAVNPELVIIGQRFASYYEEIKTIVPDAAVVDLSFQLSKEAGESGDSLINGLKNSTIALGKIFDKNAEAEELIEQFDAAIEEVANAYNGEDKIMAVVVSGGEIGFSAPYSGRVWGPMYDIFNWVSALDIENATSDHKGDDISVEAIAQSNPDWIMVLDREAAMTSQEAYVPAKDVINNSLALQNTEAVQNEQIIFAPNDTYTNESIQTYLELFENTARAFSAK